VPVEFTCDKCGRDIRVKDELAGRRTKCPGCSETVTVPEDEDDRPRKRSSRDDDDDRPRKRSSRDEEDGRPRKRSSRDDDDRDDERTRKRSSRDDDDGRDRKPAKKKAGGSWLPLILGISGGVFVLVVAVVLLWWLFGGGGGGALAQWVPGDGESFFSMRVADLMNYAKFKEFKDKYGSQMNQMTNQTEGFGLKPENVDRATQVQAGDGAEWAVIETNVNLDEAKIMEALKGPKEETAEGKKYIWGDNKKGRGKNYIHFVSSRIFVQSLSEKGIKKALATAANRKAGPLDDALSYVSTSRQVVFGFKMPKPGGIPGVDEPRDASLTLAQFGMAGRRGTMSLLTGDRQLAAQAYSHLAAGARGIKSGVFCASVSSNIVLESSCTFDDSEKATKTKDAAEAGLKLLKSGKLDEKAKKGLGSINIKILDSICISQRGATMFAKATFDITPSDDVESIWP
jgi:hypothetical protein